MKRTIQYVPLFNRILREFNLELSGKFIPAPSERNPNRQKWEGEFTLTPLKGGPLLKGVLTQSRTLESQVCRVVSEALPGSRFSKEYTDIVFGYRVKLVQARLENAGYLAHVALRKYCDSKGSSLWWRLLNRLDGKRAFGLFHRALLGGYHKTLMAEGAPNGSSPLETVRMGALIANTLESLEFFFSCYRLFDILATSSLGPLKKEFIENYGFSQEFLEGCSYKDFDELSLIIQDLYLSLDYLSNTDLEILWSDIVEQVTVPT